MADCPHALCLTHTTCHIPEDTMTDTGGTCTIVTEFFGITLDPCGLDATHTSTGRCDRGHTRTRHICTNHARAFAALPAAVVCAQCAEEGHDTQAVLTITAAEVKP